MRKAAAFALLVCAVMVLVALTPLTMGQTGDVHTIVKGEKGPRASAVTWVYMTGAEPGIWSGLIVNDGLRSLVIDVADNTSGVPEEIFHQRIRFAAYGIYPSGTMQTEPVTMAANRMYEITATPNGPRWMSCTVTDQFDASLPPVAMFSYTAAGAVLSVDGSGSYDPDGMVVDWAWDFGDGETGSGMTAVHTYQMSSTYTVTLTVTDDDGLWSSTSQDIPITVPNRPPVARFTYTTNHLIVNVDGSTSSDIDGTIVSWDWQWGDGMTGSGMTASHEYAMDGTYNVVLTVTDDMGASGSASQSVMVAANKAPVASFTYTVSGMTVNVDGSGSSDVDGTIDSYAWNWGDASPMGSGMTASHTYAMEGTYPVTLTVTDNDMATGSSTQDVLIIANDPPVASFTTAISHLKVDVDASASTDPDGTIVSYAWAWGDGMTGSGMTATHTYAMDGTYTIVLTVTDNYAAIGTASETVTVAANKAPVASFTYVVSLWTVDVDGSGSYDLDGTIGSYAWNWGDGSAMGSGMTASHTYAAEGTFLVTLTVTDNDMATGSSSQQVLIDVNDPPVAMFTALVSGMTVSVDGSGSSDVDGTIASYAWNWGDGSAMGSGMTASHTYDNEMTYTITLTVTDDDGATASASKDVLPVDNDPIAAFTFTVNGLTVNVDASGSSDDYGIVSFVWSWGDGTSSTGMTASHTYTPPGATAPMSLPMATPSSRQPPPPPYNVVGTTYDPDGLALAGCDVTILNTRTGSTLTTVSDATGVYQANLNNIPGGWIVGDLIRVTAVKGTLTGVNEAQTTTGPFLWIDVHLQETSLPPFDVTITLTVTDGRGQTSTVSQTVTLYP